MRVIHLMQAEGGIRVVHAGYQLLTFACAVTG